MSCDIDAVRQSADDKQIGDGFSQSRYDSLRGCTSVGRDIARTYNAQHPTWREIDIAFGIKKDGGIDTFFQAVRIVIIGDEIHIQTGFEGLIQLSVCFLHDRRREDGIEQAARCFR